MNQNDNIQDYDIELDVNVKEQQVRLIISNKNTNLDFLFDIEEAKEFYSKFGDALAEIENG